MEEAVKLLLGRWQRARESLGPDGKPVIEPGIAQCLNVGEERIRAALEFLALSVHERQRSAAGADGEPGDIPKEEVLAAFNALMGTLDPAVLFSYLEHRAGLLIARCEGVYAFPHRSFQEFLTACYLANQPDFTGAFTQRVRTDPEWWREVWLLGAGALKRPGFVMALLDEILPDGPAGVTEKSTLHWILAALAGQTLVETRLIEKAAGQPATETLVQRCREWLIGLVEGGHTTPRERAAAADVLGQLGDARFNPSLHYLPKLYRGEPEPMLGFVEVPAGRFVMGSRKGDKEAEDSELGNPKLLTIPYEYHFGRYPVTVAQFEAFVSGGGIWMALYGPGSAGNGATETTTAK